MSDGSFEGEEHYDEYEHYNFEQDKAMNSGHSGKILVCQLINWKVKTESIFIVDVVNAHSLEDNFSFPMILFYRNNG